MRRWVAAGLLACMTTAMARPVEAHELHLGMARTSFSEGYLAQELDSHLNALDQFSLGWQSSLGETDRLVLNLTRASYRLEDATFPGTQHRRQQTGLMAGARRAFDMAFGTAGLGLGYGLEVMQVENSATLAEDDPAFLFLPWQAYHGPAMLADLRIPLIGPVGFRVGMEWQPFVFAHLSDARLAMPGYLTSIKVDPRVTLWGDRLSFGYAYQRMLGSGYDRSAGGFLATLSLFGI
ncbi:hypothetical protein D3C72_230510 [compost metagenome]